MSGDGIFGVLDDEDKKSSRPKRSALTQKIADTMYKLNCSYATAYDMVMNPPPTASDEVKEKLKVVQQTMQQLPQEPYTFEKYLIEKLGDDVKKLEEEKANIEPTKQSWLRKKEKSAEVARRIMALSQDMDKMKADLLGDIETLNAKKKRFNEHVDKFNGFVKAIHDGIEKAQKETKGYIKEISLSEQKEFEREN